MRTLQGFRALPALAAAIGLTFMGCESDKSIPEVEKTVDAVRLDTQRTMFLLPDEVSAAVGEYGKIQQGYEWNIMGHDYNVTIGANGVSYTNQDETATRDNVWRHVNVSSQPIEDPIDEASKYLKFLPEGKRTQVLAGRLLNLIEHGLRFDNSGAGYGEFLNIVPIDDEDMYEKISYVLKSGYGKESQDQNSIGALLFLLSTYDDISYAKLDMIIDMYESGHDIIELVLTYGIEMLNDEALIHALVDLGSGVDITDDFIKYIMRLRKHSKFPLIISRLKALIDAGNILSIRHCVNEGVSVIVCNDKTIELEPEIILDDACYQMIIDNSAKFVSPLNQDDCHDRRLKSGLKRLKTKGLRSEKQSAAHDYINGEDLDCEARPLSTQIMETDGGLERLSSSDYIDALSVFVDVGVPVSDNRCAVSNPVCWCEPVALKIPDSLIHDEQLVGNISKVLEAIKNQNGKIDPINFRTLMDAKDLSNLKNDKFAEEVIYLIVEGFFSTDYGEKVNIPTLIEYIGATSLEDGTNHDWVQGLRVIYE